MKTVTKHTVKRAGHLELYDDRKLFASIYAACLAVRVPVGEAELVAEKVCTEVRAATAKQAQIPSQEIRREASRFLKSLNPDAGYIYQTHRNIS